MLDIAEHIVTFTVGITIVIGTFLSADDGGLSSGNFDISARSDYDLRYPLIEMCPSAMLAPDQPRAALTTATLSSYLSMSAHVPRPSERR